MSLTPTIGASNTELANVKGPRVSKIEQIFINF